MREQRLVFGEAAELYERARPSYPDVAVERVLALAAPARRVVEVGAGTGKLTRLLAAKGVEVLALEPDHAMAAVGARVCADLPVRFEHTLFEHWRAEPASVDAVVAAQSWHWVPAGERVERAAAVIRPGGVVAAMWNFPQWGGTPLRGALDAIYAELAPDVDRIGVCGPGSSSPPIDANLDDDLASSPHFEAPVYERFEWTHRYQRDDWLALLGTHSGHLLLGRDRLVGLTDAIGAAIDAHGGSFVLDSETLLVWARRR